MDKILLIYSWFKYNHFQMSQNPQPPKRKNQKREQAGITGSDQQSDPSGYSAKRKCTKDKKKTGTERVLYQQLIQKRPKTQIAQMQRHQLRSLLNQSNFNAHVENFREQLMGEIDRFRAQMKETQNPQSLYEDSIVTNINSEQSSMLSSFMDHES